MSRSCATASSTTTSARSSTAAGRPAPCRTGRRSSPRCRISRRRRPGSSIPIIYGIDTIHGANYVLGATLFPHNIAMGATGNVELDGKDRRDRRPGDPGGGHPLELRSGARSGPPAAVAPRVRDLRRGPVHRLDDGSRLHPGPAGRRPVQPGQGRDVHEALSRLLPPLVGPGPHARPTSRSGSCANGSSSPTRRRSRRAR